MTDGLRPRRVTVVDDSPDLLALFGDALRFDGVELALFDGSATLQDIEASTPDLLVVDLRLGTESLTGMEIIRLARAHRQLRHVPIVVCSAAVDQLVTLEPELSEIPNLFVLPKPFSLGELDACVGEALARRVGAATDR